MEPSLPIPNRVMKRCSGDDNYGATHSENTSRPAFLLVWYNSGIMSIPLSELETKRDECFESATARKVEVDDGDGVSLNRYLDNWRMLAVLVAEARVRELTQAKDREE